MKLLALIILFASQSLLAASFTCVSEKNKYTIEASYEAETQIINSLVYKKGQELAAEFTNLSYTEKRNSVLFSSKKIVSLDVNFKNENARYLTIDREEVKGNLSSTGTGAFIPKNSILSLEYHITCQFQD